MLSAIAPIPSTLQVQAQPQLDSFKHTPRRCVNNAQQKTDRWSELETIMYEGQKSGQSQRVDYAGETSRTNTLPSQVVPYNAKVVQNFQEKLRAKYMAELPEICQFSAYIVFNLPA